MAWGAFNARGVAQNKTAAALLSVSPTQAVSANAVLTAVCVSDNISTGGGATSDHTLFDSRRNYWHRAFERSNAAAAAGGVTASVWVCWVSNALATTDVVYLAFPSNVTAKAIGLFEASVAADKAPGVVAVAHSEQDATSSPTVTLSGLAEQEYALLGVVAREADSAGTFNQDADYTDRPKFGTTGGAAGADVSAIVGTRLATLTSDTFAPTALSVAADVVTGLVALYEAPMLSLTVTDIHTQGGKTYVRWSDKVEQPFNNLTEVRDYALGSLNRDVIRQMALARYLAIDPAAGTPSVIEGHSIVVTNARNMIVETR